MHRAHALFLVPIIALGLGACSLRKKPVAAAPPAPKPAASTTPTPPPEPLSAPQTSVQLPPPQPLSAEAIHSMEPPETTPAPPPTPRPRPPSRGPQRPVETVPPPVVAPPVSAEPERPPLQEQLPPTETKRLQEEAASRKAQARHLVDQAKRRRLSRQENGLVERINSFIKNSEDAEKRGDIRQASELAERALVLAQGLKP